MKKIITFLIAGALAASMCVALSGCGGEKSTSTTSSVTSVVKATKATTPPATTVPATGTGTTSSQSSTITIDPNNVASITPDANYKYEGGADLVDAAMEAAAASKEDGDFGQVLGTYDYEGSPYYCIAIFGSDNKCKGLWWVSEDGSEAMDTETFYSYFVNPEFNSEESGAKMGNFKITRIGAKTTSSTDTKEDGDDSDEGEETADTDKTTSQTSGSGSTSKTSSKTEKDDEDDDDDDDGGDDGDYDDYDDDDAGEEDE